MYVCMYIVCVYCDDETEYYNNILTEILIASRTLCKIRAACARTKYNLHYRGHKTHYYHAHGGFVVAFVAAN